MKKPHPKIFKHGSEEDLPGLLWCKDVIYICKELAKGILCAGPPALLIVCCEEGSVVCPWEVHILVRLRKARC